MHTTHQISHAMQLRKYGQHCTTVYIIVNILLDTYDFHSASLGLFCNLDNTSWVLWGLTNYLILICNFRPGHLHINSSFIIILTFPHKVVAYNFLMWCMFCYGKKPSLTDIATIVIIDPKSWCIVEMAFISKFVSQAIITSYQHSSSLTTVPADWVQPGSSHEECSWHLNTFVLCDWR